jgi:predicted nucleic acid-binding protein
MTEIRTHYLDASAIVKLLVDDDRSAALRAYLGRHAVHSTTSLCFAEVLGVLKRFRGKLLTEDEYFAACEDLMAHLRGNTLEIDDIGVSQRHTFDEAEQLAKKYSLDLIDAYQLVTLKQGLFSNLEGDSKPILVTADEALAKAAKSEGLRSWDCLREPAP